MFKKFFQRLKFKMMAKQLRRPSGMMGGKVGSMMNKANEFLYDFTLDVMQPANNDAILEIGFGNGKFFDKMFSKAEGVKITGLDFSETMLYAAKENNKEAVANGKLSLQFGSSDKLPFPDNSFDKIFCINVVYFWDEPIVHLKEMQRVLKPGGRFYATVRTKESMLKMPFTKYGFSFYESDNWKTFLNEAGLIFIEEKPVNEPVVEFEDNKISVQSLCVVAEKKL
ncbi:MAG: class I SAM-dependent methyltransferase [Chitinophagaceae bacterium]|nr:class I SAM-dependent methyltransferase [Chitinophagaceae bacterium]